MMPGALPPDPDRDSHWHSQEEDNPFRKREPRAGSSGEFTTVDWLLCIFCPGIGCFVGIIRMIQGQPNAGRMVGYSLLFAFLWNMLRFLILAAQH